MEQLLIFATLYVFIINAIAPIYYPVIYPPNVLLSTLINIELNLNQIFTIKYSDSIHTYTRDKRRKLEFCTSNCAPNTKLKHKLEFVMLYAPVG